jgi:hypothetical protein
MKNMSLIFGVAVLFSAALIFIGCEQETKTETQTVTEYRAADIESLEALLNTDGVSAVDYLGALDIGDGTLVIPEGKTVNVKGGVVVSSKCRKRVIDTF